MEVFIPRTIQWRLILSHLVVALVSIALISVYAGSVLFNAVRRQAEHRYEDLAFAATNELELPLVDYYENEATEADVYNSIAYLFLNKPDVHFTVYTPEGEPIVDSSGELPPAATRETLPELWDALEGVIGEGEFFRFNTEGSEALHLAVRVLHQGEVYGILRLDVPLQATLDSARQSLGLLVSSALLVALGISAVGYVLARTLAVPIQNLTSTAERLSRGDLSARVTLPEYPVELNHMAKSFNDMAGRLQAHVDELRSFVANASHEFRTPLTSIKLRVEALRNGALEEPQVTGQFLKEIESEVDRLSSMVNDLLDLSRIEAGLDNRQREAVNLGLLVNEVHETFRVRAEKAGITIECEVEPELGFVLAHEDQMRRMIYNLVDNAVKYTSQNGSVCLELKAGDSENTVRFVVSDNGYGIAHEHLPHIFERFYRIEATRPRYGPPQGSGLGLAIARSIVESHGGKIGVTSRLGEGTTFWVELPVMGVDLPLAVV